MDIRMCLNSLNVYNWHGRISYGLRDSCPHGQPLCKDKKHRICIFSLAKEAFAWKTISRS